MVHGAGGGGWQWLVWQDLLEDNGFAVIAPDLFPGENGIAETQFSDYRDQVVEWIGNDEAGPCWLVGSSLGGLLALDVATRVPVAGLILVNSVPPRNVAGWPAAKASFPLIVPWSRQTTVEESLKSLPDFDVELASLCAGNQWRDESGRVLDAVYTGIDVAPPSCPVLVVTGAADTDIPASYGRALAHWLRGDFVEYAGVSHLGPLLGSRAAVVAAMSATWMLSRDKSAVLPLGG